LFYVVLAPFVGAFADSQPKGKVMLISNFIKVVGCLMMLFGSHPLLAYAVVGLGAAAYSPAKYGILTELLPASQLVKANGWIEGLTICSIILGVLLGGQLVGHALSSILLAVDVPFVDTGIDTPPEAAISILVLVYALAAWFNTRIPLTGAALVPLRANPDKSLAYNLLALLPDFWHCSQRLWRDKLGQISLASTTLFWGVSGNLRYIVLAWSAVALGYTTTQASSLVGVVAIGTAVGAVTASMRMRLDHAPQVIPLGIAMGVLVVGMNFINQLWMAAPFLVLLGGLGGYLVVPMNALLQHRGHNLMGAGRSIAVQNMNEQLCILTLGGLYSLSTSMGVSAYGAITAFGVLVAYTMWLIKLWHASNHLHHREELARLLHVARNDNLHG
jgi:MFS transporter, LPLT family, lysophospholipid transporter